MLKVHPRRNMFALAVESQDFRADGDPRTDLFAGLAVLFVAVGGLVLGVGVWLHGPIFGISAGAAFAAALGFGLAAYGVSSDSGLEGRRAFEG